MRREPDQPSQIGLHRQLTEIWHSGRGLQRLGAVNHTVLGKRFMVTAFVFFVIGGLLAMLIRAQLATPHSAFVDAATYNQIFTMHGTVMMFLFAIPMLEGAAIYFLPKMLGARDLAFPRLTAFGYWCFLFGGTIIVVAMLFGVAPDSGWFMYTPLSSRPFTQGVNADVWLLGVTFVEISAVCAAVEIAVSILKLRAPGMSLDKMPIFGWYMLVTALMMIFGFPPLILASILLEVERAFDFPFFDPMRGGDSLLWQHLFWLFGHPEVYIIFVPAAGAVSMILPVLARNPLMGYRAIVVALIALAFLSFGIWVHHMFTVGIPHLALAFFSAASALVAIPTGIQIFAWIATLAHGRPRLEVPMLYIFGFLFVFVAGGLTGVMLAMVPFNWQAHDTHFVVAHLHYVLVGGFVFPMLAAAYYWLPQVTGRLPVFKLSIPAFWLIFIGFNVTFFGMHFTGLRGMPRRVFTYPADVGWDWLNLISSIGGFVLTIGFALFVLDVVLQLRFGRRFRRNPWEAGSLEWAQPTPPPAYNFASLPSVDRRADTLDADRMGAELAAGRGYLGFTRNGWMETLAVDLTTGRPEQVVILPNQSFLPLWTALSIAGFVVLLLFQLYWFSLVPLALVLVFALKWTRTTGQREDWGPIPIGRGESAPTHYEVSGAPSWWGMVFTLFANGTLFASLVFGALFLWAVAPNWPPPTTGEFGLAAPVLALLAFALAAGANHMALAANRRGALPLGWLALCAAAHLAAVTILVWFMRNALPDPTSHAFAATSFALLAYAAFHGGLGAVFALYGFERVRQGYVSPIRSLDLRIGSLWHDYTAGSGAIAIILVVLMPLLVAMGAWRI
jgi:cytochrome c oxidase subunit I+III